MKVLVIIPAYNEENSIEQVVENLKKIIIKNICIDYVIINDCSKDRTKEICIRNNYNFIDLPVNLGIGGGVQTGYKYAVENNYDIAIQMDGDGQHEASCIEELIKPILNESKDMVIGSRFIKKNGFQSSFMRRVGIVFLKNLIYLLCHKKVYDTTSGFRAVSKSLIKFFSENYAQDYPEPEAIIAAVLNGFEIDEIPVIMHERQGGESSINALESIYYMIKVSLAIVIYRLGILKRKK